MENIKENAEEIELTPAEKHYLKHKEAMKRYNTKNKEIVYEKNKQYLKKIKDDPEKYEKYLEKRRQAYHRRKLEQEEK